MEEGWPEGWPNPNPTPPDSPSPPTGCHICGKEIELGKLAKTNGCSHEFCYGCIYEHWFGKDLLKEQQEQEDTAERSEAWFEKTLRRYENEFPSSNYCPVCDAFFSKIEGPVEFDLKAAIYLQKVQQWHDCHERDDKRELTKGELELYEKKLSSEERQEIQDRANVKFQWTSQYRYAVRECDRTRARELHYFAYIPTLQEHFHRYYRKCLQTEYRRKNEIKLVPSVFETGDPILESFECKLSDEKLRELHEKAYIYLINDGWEEYCYDHLKLPRKKKFLDIYLPCLKKHIRKAYISFMCELYRPCFGRRVVFFDQSFEEVWKEVWMDGQVFSLKDSEELKEYALSLPPKCQCHPEWYKSVNNDILDFRCGDEYERFICEHLCKLYDGIYSDFSRATLSKLLGKLFQLRIKGKAMGNCIEFTVEKYFMRRKHKVTTTESKEIESLDPNDHFEPPQLKKYKVNVPRNSK